MWYKCYGIAEKPNKEWLGNLVISINSIRKQIPLLYWGHHCYNSGTMLVLASQNCSQYIFMGDILTMMLLKQKRSILLLPSPTLSLHPFSPISWTKPEATRPGSQPKKSISLLDTTPLRSRENRRRSNNGSDGDSPRTSTHSMLPDTLVLNWDVSRSMSFSPGSRCVAVLSLLPHFPTLTF